MFPANGREQLEADEANAQVGYHDVMLVGWLLGLLANWFVT